MDAAEKAGSGAQAGAPPTPVGKSPEAPFDPALREKARTSWTLGLVAIILAMLACGSSYITLLGALPLGLMASANARAVLGHPDLDSTSEVYARTGQITGIAAALWGALGLLMLATIVVLYGGLIAAAIFGANL